ncbi:unnamed protein product [Kuraishia capsulata CBS 1993]|uniref:Uncharacterized protein n=1 Tax=Kuraishia capsulata CBS 1993 TaxID=1382522 RepID=W6MIT2_9ASCO|nr:uncharacterized protein KUCA_T00002037001 [Kuraishia capsulata CBS 1993]CDK26066.1 unnamed protein product [Kuraishia capsulata CBS 1993]
MLGLDNAGKTTILYKLKLGKAENTVPTVGFNVETIKFRNITMHTWDIGGQERIRALWRHYFSGTDCLIYVVDSSDLTRLEQSKAEMWKVIKDKELADCLLVVLANKQDVDGALKPKAIIDKMELEKIENHTWCVIPTVAINGIGLTEALSWISSNYKESK